MGVQGIRGPYLHDGGQGDKGGAEELDSVHFGGKVEIEREGNGIKLEGDWCLDVGRLGLYNNCDCTD